MDRGAGVIMIEFVLSKLWTVLFGLALIGVLVVSFDSIDNDNQMREMETELENIMNVLDGLSDLPLGSSLRVSLDELICEREVLELENGSLILSTEDISFTRVCEVPILLFHPESGLERDFSICLSHESIIFLERDGSEDQSYLTFHLAKSSMISLRTFTNR